MPDPVRLSPTPGPDDALELIDELRDFAAGLGPVHRRLLAALLAPGIEAAWRDDERRSPAGWDRWVLPEHLAAAVREAPLGLGDD